ncbi:MAG: hypothetical protein JWP58_1625 [Hymenobacter sp.]|nr:hypothetical protein [Hymenobacter sp.]
MRNPLLLYLNSGLLGLLLSLAACTATRPPNPALQAEPEYCVPPLAYRYDPATAPLPSIEPLLDSALTARFRAAACW